MQINRTTDYALRILTALSQSEGLTNRTHLCERTGVTEAFTRKLLRILKQEGFLLSSAGVNGGYRLGRPPDDITLYDVMQVMEGANLLGYLVEPDNTLPSAGRKVLAETQKTLEKTLKGITISGLAGISAGEKLPIIKETKKPAKKTKKSQKKSKVSQKSKK